MAVLEEKLSNSRRLLEMETRFVLFVLRTRNSNGH